MSRYRFIEVQQGHYPVRLLCQLVQVPASGYYAWKQTQQQVVKQSESAWETALVKVFGHHKRCYGGSARVGTEIPVRPFAMSEFNI